VPVMAHPRSSDPSTAPQGVELLAVGDDDVDFTELLAALGRRGARHVVCEGGPGVLGQMAAADLIDEYLLTLSPRLVGGSSVGLLAGAEATGGPHHLHRVLGDGDHLMLSSRRRPQRGVRRPARPAGRQSPSAAPARCSCSSRSSASKSSGPSKPL
jgi:riboflavin biosynthesis pyrimidine reductase